MRITVEFNYDPDMPTESRHMGNPERCLVYGSKEFKNFDAAKKFLLECTSPITTLNEINKMEWEVELRSLKAKVRNLEYSLKHTEDFNYEIIRIR